MINIFRGLYKIRIGYLVIGFSFQFWDLILNISFYNWVQVFEIDGDCILILRKFGVVLLLMLVRRCFGVEGRFVWQKYFSKRKNILIR